jgi:phosphonate transport system substrate-binding protein
MAPLIRFLFFGGLVIAVGTAIFGCEKDRDEIVVDFAKTVDVEQPESSSRESTDLNVAVAAMISPKETIDYYRELLNYIGAKMGRGIRLVQRKTYGEVNEMFLHGQIDLAFICSGPYAVGKQKYGFEALATPIVRDQPFYQSYLIVNKDSSFRELADLRNRNFAFTDPDSNTGTMVPRYWLAQMGETPESFFKSFTYTYSHDNSILAVARLLVDGAAVDGLMWEYYNVRNPIYTSRTKVIKKSEPFGSPPLVASVALPPQDKQVIGQLVFNMHLDPEGKKILEKLMIDRFAVPEEEWYEPIRIMKQRFTQPEG